MLGSWSGCNRIEAVSGIPTTLDSQGPARKEASPDELSCDAYRTIWELGIGASSLARPVRRRGRVDAGQVAIGSGRRNAVAASKARRGRSLVHEHAHLSRLHINL